MSTVQQAAALRDSDPAIADGVHAMAIERLDRGEPDAVVEERLVAAGVSADAARRIIADHHQRAVAAAQSDGRTDVRFGLVALALAVVVLVVTGVTSSVGWLGMIAGSMSVWRGLKKQRTLPVGA